MNAEPQTYGLPDWHFPSPSATPRSTAAHQLPFQTPKADSPSHFADAFCTPQATGQQTPVQTPRYFSFSVASEPSTARTTPLMPDDPKFHINHFSRNLHLPLPPVKASNRLTSSPDPQASSSTLQRSLSVPRGRPSAQMNPFQMQTPPPTRDSSSRRDFDQEQQHAQQTHGGNIPQGPMGTPASAPQPNFQTPNFQTPLQYPGWQFSPDLYQFQNAPASAPAMPQTRFPWDQSPQVSSFQQEMMHSGQSPFIPTHPVHPNMQNWPVQNSSPVEMHGSFAQPSPMHPLAAQEDDFWTSGNAMNHSMENFSSQNTSFTQTTTGVNPNLLFSFSSPPHTIDPASVKPHAQSSPSDPNLRQPYEQQTRESNLERELARRVRQQPQPQLQPQPQQQQQQHNRASSSFGNNGRPGLQRSNTDSGFRKNQTRAVDSRPMAQAMEHISRKPSPLKRNSQASLTSIPEAVRPRARTRLIVDENGTARTVTISDVENPSLGSHRSFSGWGDEGESSEDDPIFTSQRNSFISSALEMSRPPKHARMDSDPDRFDITKRPLSSASISSLASRLGSTPIGHKLSDPNRRYSQESFGASLKAELEMASFSSQDTVLAEPDEGGDAQDALKRLVEGRLRRDLNDPNATIKARRSATNPFRSSSAMDITKFPSPPSPTRPTSSIHTPATDRSSRSTDSTRCVCASTDDTEALMIQCESCAKWLHVRCVFGKRAETRSSKLPSVYVCGFCTGQLRPPVEQLAASGNFYGDDAGFGASPLGYKSGYRG